MKFNKTILSIGTLAAVVTPIATVVSCGDSKPTDTPPVTHKGGQTPGQAGAQSGNPGTSGGQPAVGHSDKVTLAEGILNYMPVGTFTDQQLTDVFNKFTTKMDFTGPAFTMTNIGAASIDSTKSIVKIMIVVKPIQNHGTVVYLVGNLKVGLNGHIYFTYGDFNKAESIKDEPVSGATSFHQVDITNPNEINKNIMFAFMPDLNYVEVFARLNKIAADNGITK